MRIQNLSWRFLVNPTARFCRAGILVGVFSLSVHTALLQAQQPRVAGLHELLVVEPGTHRDGLPAAIVDDSGETLCVDIPPTLHIHRYYYSGDHEFQGPIIQGGPTIIVANHPHTGERLYTEVTLPPGAPVIAYCRSSITYVYDNSRVTITYPKLHADRVRVHYHSGRGLERKAGEVVHDVAEAVGEKVHNSSFANTIHETLADGGVLVKGIVGGVDHTASGLIDRTKAMLGGLPGVAAIRSYGEESPLRTYWSQIDTAKRKKEKVAIDFVPTNR